MNRGVLIGLVVLIAGAVAVYLFLQQGAPAPETGVSDPRRAPSQTARDITFPTFDTIRVDRDGTAVIAGRAEARSSVTVMSGADVLARATANAQGAWSTNIDEPLAPGNYNLRVQSRLSSGETVSSRQTVAVVVPERAAEEEAVAVISEPGAASRVVQRPGPGVATRRGELLVDTVDYSDDGRVIVSGQADSGTAIRAYVDNDFIGETSVPFSERWELMSNDPIPAGTYTMRIDQVDDTGSVLSRLSIPFTRASTEAIARLRDTPGSVSIQPGDNLWTISRGLYGDGILYTVIYLRNKDQIRDPDLIYPGQVFATPDL